MQRFGFSVILLCLAAWIGPTFSYDDGRPFLLRPDIFIIGAMKCGTTSLNRLFFEHPQVCSYGEKEKHFFDKSEYETDYFNHKDAYLEEFRECKRNQLTIDSTPSYIQFADIVAKRLNESYSKTDLLKKKFILILREPIARYYSEYQMRLRVCFKGLYKGGGATDDDETKSRISRNCRGVMLHFEENASKSKRHHQFRNFSSWIHESRDKTEIVRGYYLQHIRDFLQVVPRRNLFIVDFQRLIMNTNATVFALGSFYGIDPILWLRKSGSYAGNTTHGITLPSPRQNKPDFNDGALDCESWRYLRDHYVKQNTGLANFINRESGERPAMEPFFQDWNYTTPKCSPTSKMSAASVEKKGHH